MKLKLWFVDEGTETRHVMGMRLQRENRPATLEHRESQGPYVLCGIRMRPNQLRFFQRLK